MHAPQKGLCIVDDDLTARTVSWASCGGRLCNSCTEVLEGNRGGLMRQGGSSKRALFSFIELLRHTHSAPHRQVYNGQTRIYRDLLWSNLSTCLPLSRSTSVAPTVAAPLSAPRPWPAPHPSPSWLVVAAFPPKNGRLFAIWIDTMSAWAPAFSPRSLGCALGTAAFMFFAALGTAAQVRLCHSAAPPVLAIVYEYETTNNHFRFRWERESSLPGSQDPKAEVCPRRWRYQAIPTRSHHSSKTFYS